MGPTKPKKKSPTKPKKKTPTKPKKNPGSKKKSGSKKTPTKPKKNPGSKKKSGSKTGWCKDSPKLMCRIMCPQVMPKCNKGECAKRKGTCSCGHKCTKISGGKP